MRKTIFFFLPFLVLVGAGCPGNTPQFWSLGQELADRPIAASVELDLSGRGLHAVPSDVLRRDDVTSLDLSDNELSGALPAEIRQMRSLRTLDVSGNQMTGVPAEIGQLSELSHLDLSDNLLTGLPYELGQLHNLKTLDLSGNDYSEADLEIIEVMLPPMVVINR